MKTAKMKQNTDFSIQDSSATIFDVVVFPVPGAPVITIILPCPNYVCPFKSRVYIVLRANKEEIMKRAVCRSKLDMETNIQLVKVMWEQWVRAFEIANHFF